MKKILLFLILCLITLSSFYSQPLSELRVTGKATLLDGELVAREIKDANGNICGMVIVLTDLEGLTFTSSYGMCKNNSIEQGRYKIFLSPGERVLEVLKSGYKPLKIFLNEVGITVESGKVWQIEITGDKKLDLIPITVRITPEDAAIYLDGKIITNNKPILTSIGKHRLRAEQSNSKTLDKEIEVSQSNVFFEEQLTSIQLIKVTITSEPVGAKIYLNGTDTGKETNYQSFYLPGKYLIRVSKSGYLDETRDIEVVENQKNEFKFRLVKNSGLLKLNLQPLDAKLLINQEDYSSQRNIELPTGTYKIELTKPGYYDQNDFVTIEIGKTVEKTYNLKAQTGKLMVTVQPIEAKCVLSKDGKEVRNWTGSEILNDLLIGEYSLKIIYEGFEEQIKRIIIENNKTTIEEFLLKKSISKRTEQIDNMVFVEGGEFMLGSESGEFDEKPVHKVVVKSFYIDKYEVTQREYEKVMGNNPSYFKNPSAPVEQVSWNDAVAYAQKVGKRLPTEAEWEYAARGGNKSRGYTYSGSNTIGDVAWYGENSRNTTRPVGTKEPNELGIYDMSGNVWEWCSDWYSDTYYSSSPLTNPTGPSSGTYRVMRGGSWYFNDIHCRVAGRNRSRPTNGYNDDGFRCVQDK